MKTFYLIALLGYLTNPLPAQYFQNGLISTNHPGTHAINPVDCDTIFSFSTLLNYPSGLTFDGTNLYTIASFSDSICKFDLSGQFIESIPYPGTMSGGDLDFDGEYLWAVSEQDGSLYKISPTNGTVAASIKLPGDPEDPNYFGCAYDNGFLWVTEYILEILLRIDAASGEIIDSFAINRNVLPLAIINDDLYGVEFIDIGQDLSMQLIKFDKSDGSITDSSSWCLPYALGLCRTENNTWGLSGGADIGYSRIYEFDSLLTSVEVDYTFRRAHTFFPNPFTGSTKIKYELQRPGPVMITFYNQSGRQVDRIEQKLPEGLHQLTWTTDLPPGIYYFRLQAGDQVSTGKVVKM